MRFGTGPFRSAILAVGLAVLASVALASGSWVEQIPFGGVEIGPGPDRAALDARMDEIEREMTGQPFIRIRSHWLSEMFNAVRLAVNTNDLFVHWHPDTSVLADRFKLRQEEISRTVPGCAGLGVWATGNGTFLARVDVSHTCPDWKSVLELGPRGLADRARRRMATASADEERTFLRCVVRVYEALAGECLRWADLAESKGMSDVAAVLRENAAHPPRTLREALQWALVYDRAQEAEGEDVRSQGLFDRLFIGFYRRDLAEGRETRTSAKRLIADWFDRFWSQNHPNNKNIAIGGYDAGGHPVWNELTELAVEVFYERNRVNPKLTYRFGAKTPREQLEKVTRCLTDGRTSVVFANEEVLYETFRRRGKDSDDLSDYVLVGCYEPCIGGREIVSSMAVDFNLAKPIESVFARQELPKDATAFEAAYVEELERNLDEALTLAKRGEEHWPEINPAPLFSGSFADCIAAARDMSDGGCRYNQSGVDCGGLATAVDSLAAIRYLVDETGTVTMRSLKGILSRNWKDADRIRNLARRAAPKWGNNDDRADAVGRRIYERIVRRINRTANGHGGTFQAGFWSINRDIPFGGKTGATPDGRLAGDPISRNNAATAGCGRQGPTALMLSNLKLDQRDCPDGHILDVMLPASLARKDDAAATIAALIGTYFAQGGQCLHLNSFDSRMLRDAQAHPEKYADLQVRVCGWNVRWNDLSRIEQEHFIATAEAQE